MVKGYTTASRCDQSVQGIFFAVFLGVGILHASYPRTYQTWFQGSVHNYLYKNKYHTFKFLRNNIAEMSRLKTAQ